MPADFADKAEALSTIYLDAAIERVQRQARAIATRDGERCLSCGDPIPEARRQARPGALFCLPCQTERERTQR